MKKIISIILIAVLALSFSIGAFADDDTPATPSITVTGAINGVTYSAYKIFDVEYDTDIEAYAYKPATGWEGFVGEGSDYFCMVGDYVEFKEGVSIADNSDDAAALAQAALAYAKANNITAAASAKAEGEGTSLSVTLNVGTAGYYVVDSTLGSLCMLDTNAPTATVAEKNEEPPFDKVPHDVTVSIGQDIGYDITVTKVKGGQNYVVYDTMKAGLDFNNDIVVKIGDDTVPATNYSVTYPEGKTFRLAFDNDFIAGLDDETEIVITYSGKVNSDAVVKVENDAYLDFGDGNTVTHETVDVELCKFDIKKVDGAEQPLTGAEFTLWTDEDCTEAVPVIKDATTGNYRPTVTGETGTNIAVDADGKATVYGLAAGTYYLKEEQQPEGYNKLKEPVEVVLTAGATETVEKEIVNNSGAELPSTGGIGTTIFYVIGGILVVSAGVLLVTKKRVQ